MFSSFGARVGFVVLSGVFAVACAGSDGADGEHGANALMTAAPEPAGPNCAAGGQAITYGVDADEDGKLDESEVTGTSYVCNGAQGADGAQGKTGAQGERGAQGLQGLQGLKGDEGAPGATGATGATGAKGDPGAPAPQTVFGQFLATQVVAGMVVTCATTNQSASTVECRGMKVDGLDLYLGPTEANAVCAGITGKGYDLASGTGVVPAPFIVVKSGAMTVATTGNASPMQNLTCKR